MVRIKRLPLPTPFTVNSAVKRIYEAWTNRGSVHVTEIPLRNPRMVAALYTQWMSELSGHEDRADACGYIDGIGYWCLVRSPVVSDVAGTLHFSLYPFLEQLHDERKPGCIK